jgi:DNA replication factor GINS
MSHDNEDDVSLEIAYSILVKEFQIPNLQEIPYGLYQQFAKTNNNLKINESENDENKIVVKLIGMFSDIATLLLQIRMEKVYHLEKSNKKNEIDYSRITDEEKYILDGKYRLKRRLDEISSLINNGRPKILERISERLKQKKILIRFMKPIEQFVGVDMSHYGPFNSEDIANLPLENAVSLINNNIASEVFPSFD